MFGLCQGEELAATSITATQQLLALPRDCPVMANISEDEPSLISFVMENATATLDYHVIDRASAEDRSNNYPDIFCLL